ncbi:MAG: prolyl oligopeptidase family serine peptidase [Bacteroidales bacterium]
MIKNILSKKIHYPLLVFILVVNGLNAQRDNISPLKIKEIMKGEDYTGHSPDDISWSADGSRVYFFWNPGNSEKDSLYSYSLVYKKITSVKIDSVYSSTTSGWIFSEDRSKAVFEKDGDIYLIHVDRAKIYQITKTNRFEYEPCFTAGESKIAYHQDDNIYCWDVATGFTEQITDFGNGPVSETKDETLSEKDKWLQKDQVFLFDAVKKEEKNKNWSRTSSDQLKRPLPIALNGMEVLKSEISPDGKYVTYVLFRPQYTKKTIIAKYITKSGYTESINSRSKVGDKPSEYRMFVYNTAERKTTEVDFGKLEGINDLPAYLKDYPNNSYENKSRIGYISGPFWNSNGGLAFIDIKANDNKDRWLALLNFENGSLEMLDRQHDDAWIGGPGISEFSDFRQSLGWMPDDKRIWFQSEMSGYSQLYTVDVISKKKKALTSGKFELYDPFISKDKTNWYFHANKEHPGIVHFYSMPIEGGEIKKLTTMPGYNEVHLSPDETRLAIRFSTSNKPWELYITENPLNSEKSGEIVQVTNSVSKEFTNYKWRMPEIITFKARDGETVYARLYKPEEKLKNKAAVIFVHGAGYLQNAHQWWSSYSREYMFHNLLADNGFTVLDIDYRGSAGYGRDWRTGIYRHMGGNDLSDNVDGARYLIKNLGIDKEKIGIYGGSYGGFITLMAMFNAPDVFKAGAALRAVTDWAHYNHGYTSNILNTPVNDSVAYHRSSPIYYAEGLKGHLLILHGMVDDNVHFQDVVRLSQRLIELEKENWELAVYPIERHSFTETASWTDEYSRIFRFFKENLPDK